MSQLLKKRVRFTDHDDLTLLREFLGQNPIDNPAAWTTIQENMMSVTRKEFLVRTLREHVELLVKLWLKENKHLKGLSGIEVVYTEKDQLCESIHQLMMMQANKKKTLDASKKLGQEARDRCASTSSSVVMETADVFEVGNIEESNIFINGNVNKVQENDLKSLPEPDAASCVSKTSLPEPKSVTVASSAKTFTALGPVRSRKRKANVQRQGLAYLEAYDLKQSENKRIELELEERKLKLEERKVEIMERQVAIAEFEVKKRLEMEEKRMSLEIEHQKDFQKIIERQERLINVFISKNVGV